jgi:sugar phosphate isomerase/epimerase
MKIACGTVTFRECSLQNALERIKKAGYDYVEPQATAPFCPHVDVDKDDPAKFAALIKNMGFKGATALWATHGALLVDPLSVEYGIKCVEWSSAAGIPGINLGDGFKSNEMSDDDAIKLLEDRLGKILEAAQRCKTYVAIEPHGTFSLSAEGLKKLMSLSTSPWLGINYDTANIHRASYVETHGNTYLWRSAGAKSDEVAVLKTIVDKVVHVHVKDLAGEKCVALGQGEVNLKGCIEVLVKAGYDGSLSLETEGGFTGDAADMLVSQSMNYLQKTLKEIKG